MNRNFLKMFSEVVEVALVYSEDVYPDFDEPLETLLKVGSSFIILGNLTTLVQFPEVSL